MPHVPRDRPGSDNLAVSLAVYLLSSLTGSMKMKFRTSFQQSGGGVAVDPFAPALLMTMKK